MKLVRLNELKDLLHSPRYNSTMLILLIELEAFHRVRLACACLAISEYCSVVAMEHTYYCWTCCLFVYFNLAVNRSVNTVKVKLVICHQIFVIDEVLLSALFCGLLPEVFLEIKNIRDLSVTAAGFVDLGYR